MVARSSRVVARSSRVVARSSRVVGRDRVVARGKILGGRRRGVMVGREKNDFFYDPGWWSTCFLQLQSIHL